jgi:hypothetical protein
VSCGTPGCHVLSHGGAKLLGGSERVFLVRMFPYLVIDNLCLANGAAGSPMRVALERRTDEFMETFEKVRAQRPRLAKRRLRVHPALIPTRRTRSRFWLPLRRCRSSARCHVGRAASCVAHPRRGIRFAVRG